ncbi:S9 family peptidase [Croceicoccus mobilis]|uniref:Peptidase S9 n=1 Tax=Croceicoccus mobilis TaxID=1703339 RepID=A0A916Z666_9SPHN|nr:DPP IV N-terminal domain-containing protein [Croceicoccus mobilis]GGD76036.1 peptidase S9 [Croceicoccus mobilis]
MAQDYKIPGTAEAPMPVPDVPQKELTLERIAGSPSLNGASPRSMRLSPDGRYLTLLRPRDDDRYRYDLWAYDRESGEWSMLVDSEKFGTGRELSEAEKMQRERGRIGSLKGIVSYSWADDAKSILVPLDGDLFLAKLDGTVTRLTDSEEGELNPVISPDSKHVSFVREGRLYVAPIGGEPVAVTPEETSDTVHWGEAEFVAQEEMDRDYGYKWSPDGSRIAVLRYDEAPVNIVTRTSIGAGSTRTYDQRYPAAGTPNVLIDLYVMDPDGSDLVKVDIGTDPDIYVTRVDWAPGGVLYLQRVNRAQDTQDMLKIDPATGKSEVIFSEKAAEGHWINRTSNYKFLKDGSVIWWSERSGFGHLYRFANGKMTQLTKGDWVVTDLVGVDEKAGTLWFEGRMDGPLQNQLYKLDYANKGKPDRLSELGWNYGVSMDGEARTMVVARSNTNQPTQYFLADNQGKPITWLLENKIDAAHPYAPYAASHAAAHFGTLKAEDGSTLYWKMLVPPMEEGKKYPVMFHHYGGPHAQDVTKAWASSAEQFWVDKGYIYFEIDNRGSNNRGVEFEKQIREAMGTVEVADQKTGGTFLKSLAFVDPDRIAIYGGSYGGYMTLKMLEADPGFYAAGIAASSVTKWEMYDTNYTERYMGDPRKVPEAYKASNTIEDAGKISDPLLITHGMSDDNVVMDNTTAMVAAMQEENVSFEMMLYPGFGHAVGGPVITQHVLGTILRFLEQNGVPPGGR